MANAASTIEIELEIRDAINRLGKLEGELKKSSSAMDRVANSTNKMESAFKSARNAASALFAAISVQQIAQAADTFTRFANQIRIATTSAAEAAAVQKELYQVSQATGTAIEDTTKLYSRLRIAADQLGSSQAETIRITEIVAKSLAAAGTSSTEASGALLQLAQALNSPKVQAEEFNSLIDGMPNLLKEVEKQLGLTAGSLKKFVTDGNLTNQLFKDAILGSADAINEQFGAAQDTIATSFTRLNNAFILLIGNFEKSTGFFNSIASVISTLAENMDELARVLKAVAVGFTIAFAPKVIRAIRDTAAAMTVLGAATKTNVIGALAALGFYIADVTGGLDSLMEKLGLTKDKADEAAGGLVDLTKGGGGAGASQSKTYESAFFKETIKNLEGYLTDIEKYGPQITEQIDQMLFDVNRLLDSDSGFVKQTIFGSDEAIPIRQYVTELSKIVEIVEAAIKGQEEYNRLKTKDAQITEEGAALEQKILDAKFAINKAQEELNRLQKIDIYDGILNSLQRFLGIQQDITDETEKQLSNAEKQAKAREQYVNAVGDTIVSGTFGAGPNASRAGQVGQAYGAAGGGIPGLINASLEAVLSNEKVAAAIDESFELLFDTIDPLIDLLGDLISAINRLIGAFLDEAGNILEDTADLLELGPNGYFGSGQFTRDLEANFGGGGRQPAGPTSLELAYAQADAVFVAIEQEASTLEALQPKIDELSSLSPGLTIAEIITRFTDQTSAAVASLEAEKAELEEGLNQTGYKGAGTIMGDYFREEIAKLDEAIADVESKTSIVIEGLISEITGLNEIVLDSEAEIEAINYQNLTERERIELRKESAFVTIEENRALADLIEDQEVRNLLLNEVNEAEEKALELYNLQLSELQKLNEEREREASLLAIQNIETGLQGLLKDFERTIEDIGDLVQGLFDQVTELLFSEFNLASPQEAFAIASSEYQDLLAKAFEPEATEEDIKNLQGFVNEYLSASRDVYKSSSAFQEIFDNVLQDLTKLGISYGFNAPINAVSGLQKDLETILVDLPEDLQQAVSDLISGLNLAATAFAQQQVEFLTTVNVLPIELQEGNFDFDLPVVNLGTVTANFDTDGFRTAIRGLNDSIVAAVNSFTATITGAETAVETGGTATAVDPVTQAALSGGSSEAGEVYIPPSYGPVEELYRQGTALTDNFTPFLGPLNDAAFSSVYTSSNAGLYTYADLARTLQGSLDNLMGADYTKNTYQYAIGMEEVIDGTLYKAVRFITDLATANDHIRAIENQNTIQQSLGNRGTFYTKYGFRRGGIVDPLDTIPAMLSPGEYILSPETVRRYGVSNLNRLNAGDTAALNATSDPEVKRLLAELIVAVRENDTEVNVYTDMEGQTKASIEEFRSELRERTRRQGDKFLPARYI